jgi:hypothetical protein
VLVFRAPKVVVSKWGYTQTRSVEKRQNVASREKGRTEIERYEYKSHCQNPQGVNRNEDQSDLHAWRLSLWKQQSTNFAARIGVCVFGFHQWNAIEIEAP